MAYPGLRHSTFPNPQQLAGPGCPAIGLPDSDAALACVILLAVVQ
jgi:hypothetical protein